MKNQKQKNSPTGSTFFIKTAFFFLFLAFSFSVSAMPFILKSVDGSWLPMIAQSWVVQNGGVLVKITDGIKPKDLRDEMWLQNPELIIEISGKDLFFPTPNPDSLFEVLKNIHIDVSKFTVKRRNSYGNYEMFVRKSTESTVSRDEYIEALVENSVYDEQNNKLVVFIKIQQRAKTGDFTKLNGKYRIEHVFNMKNGTVDPDDNENKQFVPLITLKKGNRITFIPERYEYRVLTIKPDFRIK